MPRLRDRGISFFLTPTGLADGFGQEGSSYGRLLDLRSLPIHPAERMARTLWGWCGVCSDWVPGSVCVHGLGVAFSDGGTRWGPGRDP